jgi:transcriptional regulator with XRE-family HTH domain
MTATERVEALLARKVREERFRRSMTLVQLSTQCNVSVAMLSKIENARVSPPISTYAKIAKCFGIPLGKLFAEDATPPVSLVRKNERKQYTRFQGYTGEAIAYKKTNKKMEPFVLTYAPRGDHPPAYVHDNEELIFLLKGKLEFRYGNAKIVLASGDCLYLDANIRHSARALNGKAAQALVVEV